MSIRVPPEDSNSSIIRIEGSPKGVAKAKLELIDIIDKLVGCHILLMLL